MMTKRLIAGSLSAAALAVTFASMPAKAGDLATELTANIGATSNYVWRGATQTDDNSAISGGIDWNGESGFYLGTWASNVKFGNDASGEVELDLYGGYGGSVGDFSYQAGVIDYAYPNTPNADFTEGQVNASYKFLTIGVNYTFASQVKGDGPFNEGDVYYYASASFDLMPTWSLGLTVGHYAFNDDGKAGVGNLDYTHGQVDISKDAGDFGSFTFSVSGASQRANVKPNGAPDGDPKVFVSWAKSF